MNYSINFAPMESEPVFANFAPMDSESVFANASGGLFGKRPPKVLSSWWSTCDSNGVISYNELLSDNRIRHTWYTCSYNTVDMPALNVTYESVQQAQKL